VADLVPFEYPWQEDEVIWACYDCLPWHVEMFHDPETGELWVREWHALDCCQIWEDTEADRPHRVFTTSRTWL
jgi:hypothetical protein